MVRQNTGVQAGAQRALGGRGGAQSHKEGLRGAAQTYFFLVIFGNKSPKIQKKWRLEKIGHSGTKPVILKY